jgi:hypothetical protein
MNRVSSPPAKANSSQRRQSNECRLKYDAVEQGIEADEAGASYGASQLNSSVRQTSPP